MKKPNRTFSFSLLILFLLLLTPSEVVATWWFISQLSAVGTRILCDNIPGLVSRQRQLCRDYPDIMLSIAVGAKQGVTECQYQFKNNRWNCSTPDRDTSVFGKTVLKKASREAAFAYSISSAGAVHAITRSCSRGELLDCACDPTKRGKGNDEVGGVFDWGGCSDNVKFAMDFARKFIDARENKERDPRAMMNLHNNKAGRRILESGSYRAPESLPREAFQQAVRRIMKLECKCHGVSGSCSVRTCWLAMMDFRKVGEYLKDKYHEATKVSINQGGNDLLLSSSSAQSRKPSKVDLVYFERSPDYCRRDTRTGSLGTAGRICNRTSDGPDGCDVMCCGRGYNTKRVQQTRQCECKFHWCCFVKCHECTETVDVNTCKGARNDRLQPDRSGTDSTASRTQGNTMYDGSDAHNVLGQGEVGTADVLATPSDLTDEPQNSPNVFGLEAQQQTATNSRKTKKNKSRNRNRPNTEDPN